VAFEKLLNRILLHDHVESVIFLDSEGEEIFSYGNANHDHLKLMGAYQAIVLNSIHRLELGSHSSIWIRCGERSIITQQLKLGYFVCVLLSSEANLAHAQFQFQDYFTALSEEI
jgi:hypothetical protein